MASMGLPTSAKEISSNWTRREILPGDHFEVIFFDGGIALVIGRRNGVDCSADGASVASFLGSLKEGGHRINSVSEITYYGDIKCVLVDFEFPQRRGEEEV